MIKKIILTSAEENNNYRGKISLENIDDKILVTLSGFNFSLNTNKCLLGVKIGEETFKVKLDENSKYLIDKELDLNDKISIVILNEDRNNEILLWGSNETSRVWKNSITSYFYEEEKQTHAPKKQNYDNISSQNVEDEYESDEFVETLIDNALDNEEEISFDEEKDEKSEFLKSIESQIDELLINNEREVALEELLPNSKFVRVDSSGNGNYYIFGVIYEDSKVKYIVYGLPGEYAVKPEDEYKNYYQWLPLNSENPEGYGYYLMYQDAIEGNQVEMIIE